jgi:segregation and condensation protein B
MRNAGFPSDPLARDSSRLRSESSSGINGWLWSFCNRTSSSAQSLFAEDDDDGSGKRTRKMARLEAVLLVADGALSFRRIAQLATLADAAEVRDLVEKLNDAYDAVSCAFRVERVATGFRLMTRPRFAMWLDRLHNRQARSRLSSPMMETLAIVAYRQPVTRAEVEKIRGVASAEMLRQLMERGLLRITGEDDSLGRPFLYGTTRQFLEDFGLGSLDGLPMADSLRRQDEPDEDLQEEADEPAAETDDGIEPLNDVDPTEAASEAA